MPPQQRPPSRSLQHAQNLHTRIPPQVERAITRQMERTLPANMQKYAGAYIEQHMATPQFAAPTQPHIPSPLSTAHLPRSHFEAGQPTPPAAETIQPTQPAQPETATTPADPYSFITDPAAAPKPSFLSTLPGSGSLLGRVGMAAGGLIILLILFSIVKGAIAGKPSSAAYITIAQEQQALLHIVNGTGLQQSQPQNVSTGTQNFTVTAQLSLASSQSQLLAYLAAGHAKVTPKILSLKISTSTDQQLLAAIAATTYEATFKDILDTKLTIYSNDLKQTYQDSKSQTGRALLESNYNQAQLLLTQLDTATAP